MGSDALLSLCGEWWRARRGGRLLFMRSSSIMALISSIIDAALARPLFPGRFSSSATASGISRSVDRLPCRLAAAAGAAAAASGCAGEVGTAGEAGEKAWLRREDRPRTSFCMDVAAVSACASIASSDAASFPGGVASSPRLLRSVEASLVDSPIASRSSQSSVRTSASISMPTSCSKVSASSRPCSCMCTSSCDVASRGFAPPLPPRFCPAGAEAEDCTSIPLAATDATASATVAACSSANPNEWRNAIACAVDRPISSRSSRVSSMASWISSMPASRRHASTASRLHARRCCSSCDMENGRDCPPGASVDECSYACVCAQCGKRRFRAPG